MEAARTIRDSVEAVSRLRRLAAEDAGLRDALAQVKRLQSRRFAGTYADLLRGGVHARAARFFLDELYGERDYTGRDEQFARIAGAIERMFPAQVAQTAAGLATLHALTEDLDLQMARASLAQAGGAEAMRYVQAWRQVGRRADRRQQLEAVLATGHELAVLTRRPGLRTMLRMMRAPAAAAGLGALQQFLESGFDTFAGLARQRGAVEAFLDLVRERESALLVQLFDADLVACETGLARILGQAP